MDKQMSYIVKNNYNMYLKNKIIDTIKEAENKINTFNHIIDWKRNSSHVNENDYVAFILIQSDSYYSRMAGALSEASMLIDDINKIPDAIERMVNTLFPKRIYKDIKNLTYIEVYRANTLETHFIIKDELKEEIMQLAKKQWLKKKPLCYVRDRLRPGHMDSYNQHCKAIKKEKARIKHWDNWDFEDGYFDEY